MFVGINSSSNEMSNERSQMAVNAQMESKSLNILAGDSDANPSSTEFLDMNDDCLLTIFKNLSSHALNAIATTCVRLQTLARTTFKSNDANKYLDLTAMMKAPSLQPEIYIANFLRHFGDLIKEIDWNMDDALIAYQKRCLQFEVIYVLSAYCSGGTLEKLRMNGSAVNALLKALPRELFINLKAMHLKECDSSDGLDIMTICKNSNEIVVHPYKSQAIISLLRSAWHFPNLEKLSIPIRDAEFVELELFLERHQRVKCLKLKFDDRGRQTNVFNLATLRYCKLMEFLHLDGPRFTFSGIPIDLPNLKYLKIIHSGRGNANGVEHFINAAAASLTLEHLAISIGILLKCRTLQTTNAFTNLRTLTILNPQQFGCDPYRIELNSLTTIMQLETLTELTLNGGTFANSTIEGLSKFRNLRILRLHQMDLRNTVQQTFDAHWAILKRIERLTQFEYNSSSQFSGLSFISKLLQKLGSTESLECLIFNACAELDDEFLAAMGRFCNLRILEIRVAKCSSQRQMVLELIKQFDKLEQLKLHSLTVPFAQLTNLIEIMPRLRSIKGLKCIDVTTYQELVEIGRRLNKKLAIEIDCEGSFNNLSIGVIEENRHIVDIFFEKAQVFNEFDF